MDPERLDQMSRAISALLSRRRLAGALGLSAVGLSSLVEARKKRTKRKRRKRKKCGKAGRKPVKGKCCKKSIRVDGRCQRCDVCARGCAFSSVQEAIDAADNGDTIVIYPGTYRGDLVIAKNVRLIGAGGGAKGTIVQGSGDTSVVQIAANVVSLEHLRITGGGGLFSGGGIFNNAGTVELIGCTVSGNEAQVSVGGGIYSSGKLTLRHSTVSENEASSGGGLYNVGTLTLIASDISDNRSGHGGGLFNDANVTADSASRITANTATTSGGGIHNESGTVTLASSAIVSDNSPTNCAGTTVPNCIG